MNEIKLATIITLFVLIGTIMPKAYAQAVPTFPSCSNPQGSVKVSYSEGTHGIVGNPGTFTGSDTVFTLSEGVHVQCFCADNGNGTQTNWFHATSLTPEEVQILKNQGWISIPNGELWGLSSGEWLALNSSFTCPTGGDSNGSSTNNNSNSNNSGGQTLAASTGTGGDILGLATTGNIATIYSLFGLGISSIVASLLLKKKS